MSFLHGVSQRVVARVLAARTGQNMTPRLVRLLVKGVTHRTNLHTGGIQVAGLHLVEDVRHLLLLLGDVCGRSSLGFWPVNTVVRREPCGTELRLRTLRPRCLSQQAA